MNSPNIGDRFGRWTVLENKLVQDKHGHNKRYCTCRCDCGTVRDVSMYSLLRGVSESCGCIQSTDVIGEKFGKLTVTGNAEYEHGCGKHKLVKCVCECGNEIICRASDIRFGKKVDCGCASADRLSLLKTNDLTGRQFGNLTVIERDMSVQRRSGQHAQWICRCSLCGSVTSVSSDMLTWYGKDRCTNCIGIPSGEAKIIDLLDHAGISYSHDTIYGDCIYPETGYRLRFDFVVNENGPGTYIIEFDGIQHFKPVKHWETSTDLDGRIARDRFKNKWCNDHGIPIIRIPYTHINKIELRDLIPETSDFLLVDAA